MRTLATGLALFLGFVGLVRTQVGQKQGEPCTIVKEALIDSLKIKTGMTRGEVEKMFVLDGGVQFPHSARYLYSKCAFIKLQVDYKPTGSADSASDTVIQVSKPFLAGPSTD